MLRDGATRPEPEDEPGALVLAAATIEEKVGVDAAAVALGGVAIDDGAPAASGTAVRGRGRGWASLRARISAGPSAVTGRLADRLGERAAARRRLTRRRIVALACGVVVVGLLGYLVLLSPVLALRQEAIAVGVSGPAVDPAAVTAVVVQEVGTPLARVDVGALTATIRELPGVRSVVVSRDWPNGIGVDVVARYPVAAVPRDGELALLDSDGVQVGGLVPEVPVGLPVVEVPLGDGAAEALGAVLTVLGGVPATLLTEISAAGAGTPDTVWLTLGDDVRVEWGSVDHLALKTRVLEVLRQRPADVYDVSAPTMPVTR